MKVRYKDLQEERKANITMDLAGMMEGLKGVEAIIHNELINLKFVSPEMNNKLSKSIHFIKSLQTDLGLYINTRDFELSEHERPIHISRILRIASLLSDKELDSLANELEKPFRD